MISRWKVLQHCELGGQEASVIHLRVWKGPCLIIMLSRQPCLRERGPLKENSVFSVLLVCVPVVLAWRDSDPSQDPCSSPSPRFFFILFSGLLPNSQLRLVGRGSWFRSLLNLLTRTEGTKDMMRHHGKPHLVTALHKYLHKINNDINRSFQRWKWV